MGHLSYFIKHIIDLPKTIRFNLAAFPAKDAAKLPVLVGHRVKIKEIHKGCIEIGSEIRPYMIKIGVEGVEGVSSERRGYLLIGKDARVVFRGKTNLSRGVSIRCSRGRVEFGKNFYSNCNLSVICAESIRFGDDVLLGWDINIRDCDGHKVYVDGVLSDNARPVSVGDHVWIGAHADILKGASIPSGSIVAYRSCVLHSFSEPNILIGGYPAGKLKEGVRWEV